MKPKNTLAVSDKVFREVYDSPSSLPGRHKWLTPDEDVRKIESFGMPSKTIGARLWVSVIARVARTAHVKSIVWTSFPALGECIKPR